jgi:hypothetical protein
MRLKNSISILRNKQPVGNPDYCLSFAVNGNIEIDSLADYLDHRQDFTFEMQFKVSSFPKSGFSFLMNSCIDTDNNKVGIAIGQSQLYFQVCKGISDKSEYYIGFSDTNNWHTITITSDRGNYSGTLDSTPLVFTEILSLHLPSTLGFKIASDTASFNGLTGLVDNINVVDSRDTVAQYPLHTGSGTTAYDSVSHYDGTITNGTWQIHE